MLRFNFILILILILSIKSVSFSNANCLLCSSETLKCLALQRLARHDAADSDRHPDHWLAGWLADIDYDSVPHACFLLGVCPLDFLHSFYYSI